MESERFQWAPGNVIVLREIWLDRVWSARPATVPEVTDDWIAIYLAEGSRWWQPRTWTVVGLRL